MYPDEIEHGGVRYVKARIRQPYPGVIEQYREAVERNSRHLKVYADGRYIVDHVDSVNPDYGPVQAVEHFMYDHPLGRVLSVVGFGLMLYGMYRSLRRG